MTGNNANYHNLPEMCPKCGFIGRQPGRIAVWSEPRYRMFALGSAGQLEFACQQCGYLLTRPTVDQRRSVPGVATPTPDPLTKGSDHG